MNNPEWSDKIDMYLTDKLSATEKAQFESDTQQSAELRSQLEEQKLLMEMVEVGTLKNQLNNIDQKWDRLKKEDRKLDFRNLSIAATVILLIGIGLTWWVTKPASATEQVFASMYEADPGLPSRMDESLEFEFDDAMVDYKMGDYSKSTIKFLTLSRDKIKPDSVQFYLAMSYLGDQKYKQAYETLKVFAPEDTRLHQKGEWYLALVALKVDQQAESQSLLEKISQQSDHMFKQDADKALSLLEKK